jgi:hypothetical protein
MLHFLGMWSSSFYLGSFAGPTFSGILVDYLTYKWTTFIYFVIYCTMLAADVAEFAFLKKTTRGKCYKTFYLRNLLILVMS